jgi:membrane dipeptidase
MEFDRRTMLAGTAAALMAAPALANGKTAAGSWYDRTIIIDALGGLSDPYAPNDQLRLSDQVWSELLATGVNVVRDTVMPVGNGTDPWGEFQKDLQGKKDVLNANPDRLILVRTAADILKAKREKKVGWIWGTQDSAMFSPDLDRLAEAKKGGVMSVQLTYNNGNLAGDGSLEPRNSGLTKLGKATIERIEAEKLLLDLSHGGAQTMAEAAAFAKRPLVISHTGSRALIDHPRNTADDTIKAVADKGGVVGVYFMPYLSRDSHPTGAMLLDHVEHIANIAGEDHVGIGTDNGPLPTVLDAKTKAQLDDNQRYRIKMGIAAPGEAVGVYPFMDDYNSVDRYRRFANDLQKRGWSEARLEKLLGGNFLRVYKDAWGA